VGFVYNQIGLGGVLLLDVSSYLVSFACYFAVRKGEHRVLERHGPDQQQLRSESAAVSFFREMREGIEFLRGHREIVMLGLSWALFLSAMMTGVVVTPPLSGQFHRGAVGYGWLNAGWGVGAFVSAFYAPIFIRQFGARRSIAIALGALALSMVAAPRIPIFAFAVLIYGLMGSGRGITGVAMNTRLMEQIPKHFIGRVQNTFYAAGTTLQLIQSYVVGAVAERSLAAGFSVIALVYAIGFLSATWPLPSARTEALTEAE